MLNWEKETIFSMTRRKYIRRASKYVTSGTHFSYTFCPPSPFPSLLSITIFFSSSSSLSFFLYSYTNTNSSYFHLNSHGLFPCFRIFSGQVRTAICARGRPDRSVFQNLLRIWRGPWRLFRRSKSLLSKSFWRLGARNECGDDFFFIRGA